MTLKEFLERTQAYYGLTYPAGMKRDIAEYLAEFENARALEYLYLETRNHFSARWGKLPDCATWEELRKAVQERIKAEAQNREAETRTDRMLEDKSIFASPEEVETILGDFEQRMAQKGRTV